MKRQQAKWAYVSKGTRFQENELRDVWLDTEIKKTPPIAVLFGGGKRDRTADLLNAIQTLSQLSYTPIINQ